MGDSPVCDNEIFGFMDPEELSRWHRKFFVKEGRARYAKEEKYMDRRGLERVCRTGHVEPNFYALRHAQATLLVAGGINSKTVQAGLGHESMNTTLNIYAEEVAENDKLGNRLYGSVAG